MSNVVKASASAFAKSSGRSKSRLRRLNSVRLWGGRAVVIDCSGGGPLSANIRRENVTGAVEKVQIFRCVYIVRIYLYVCADETGRLKICFSPKAARDKPCRLVHGNPIAHKQATITARRWSPSRFAESEVKIILVILTRERSEEAAAVEGLRGEGRGARGCCGFHGTPPVKCNTL
ncbi:hypothetical protein EVAR_91422_1 [Eumeta japonica]|uniref:Uncharacterized protein n=1 Tax=Eumeta variegata TaxID=151549 RepID=A0A4C1X123_EUMVA|nr:hypothetical protein EVAR_91422_1 [Eumeta japonica]